MVLKRVHVSTSVVEWDVSSHPRAGCLSCWRDDPTNAGFHLRFLPVLSMDGNFTWLGGCIDACGCVRFVVVCTSLLSCLFVVFASVSFPVRIRPRLARVPRPIPSYKHDVHARASRSNRSNQTNDGSSRSTAVDGPTEMKCPRLTERWID